MSDEVRKVTAVVLNPLIFFDAEFADQTGQPVTCEAFVRFVTSSSLEPTLAASLARYREIGSHQRKLISAPAEENILKKLVWPLRQALVCHVLGNYLGTIALCGAVGEMLAILLFDIAPTSLGGEPLDEKKQVGLFGSTFERLGQDRRIEVLFTMSIIDAEMKCKFDLLRTKRRQYLHSFSFQHDRIAQDSAEMFYAAEELVAPVIGHQLSEGQFLINPGIIKYLEEHGTIRDYVPGEEQEPIPKTGTGSEQNGT